MDHIDEQLMYDLIDGELSDKDVKRAMAHLSSCEKCKKEYLDILAVRGGMLKLWKENLSKDCPHEDTLFAYLEGTVEGNERQSIKEHIESCPVCGITLQVANENRERAEALERASKESVPLLIKRTKDRIDKIDGKKVLNDIEKILVPSKLEEDLFAFLSKSARVLSYSFGSPLEIPALMPFEAGGVKLADTGKGFERKIITDPDAHFEIELVQFGDRFIINVKALDEEHADAIIKYALVETIDVRKQGVIFVSEGKGTVKLSGEEIEVLRPEKSPLKLKLEVLPKEDVLSNLDAEDILSLFKRLQELLLSKDPDKSDAALEAIERIGKILTE